MAAVVSHAMRRFPPSPPDVYSSYELRGEGSHQVWPDTPNGESALARSMRYADPWLYGSVRAAAPLFLAAPAAAAAALLVCSCPEAKRSSSTGVCKRCRGSRFGTVRCYPTAAIGMGQPQRAGTVRVASATSRPTILPDPYDVMRRSRMAPQDAYQLRARSTSPGKSRALEPRSYSGTRPSKNPTVTVAERAPQVRRSILECDVNPYDLLSPPVTPSEQNKNVVKLVGGKKTRVRYRTESNYEDVQQDRKSKSEASSRFKSILKKTTAFGGDGEGGGAERSPSPANGGSQFYLPLPRKKVQFLVVEKERVESESGSAKEDAVPVYEDVPAENAEKSGEEEEGSESSSEDDVFRRRTCALRRSVSERCNQDILKAIFHDTTALRTKAPRNDSRTLFGKQDPERLDGVNPHKRQNSPNKSRPRKAPPPPPPVSPASSCAENDSDGSYYQTCSTVSSCESSDESEAKNSPPSSRSSDEQPAINQQTDNEGTSTEPSVSEETVPGEITNLDEPPPTVPPRKKGSNKTFTQITTPPPVQTIKIETPPETPAINKTVVQISPVNTVHKIQIRNEFVETPSVHYLPAFSNSQRKTSILINGDDCYSTVNVNDDVPLYQSSVVVKDEPKQTIVFDTNTNSSSIYITGNFSNTAECTSPTTTVLTSFDQERNESSNQIEVTDTKENVSETETKKVDDERQQKSPDTKPSCEETLNLLLKDPVEAVRRNLVPHVCGKSDMPRTAPAKPARQENEVTEPKVLEDDDGCSEHSSSTQYELMDPGSDCYTDHSNRSSVTEEELNNRTKFYELLAESALVEVADNEDHHYESIKTMVDPIYEEIEVPPPLPSNPPPLNLLDDLQLDKEFTTRSIFEGASKYDILSYLVDAKDRVKEDNYSYGFNTSTVSSEDTKTAEPYNGVSHMSTVSDSSEDNSLIMPNLIADEKASFQKSAEVERNDSGVGSETSKSSLSKYRTKQEPAVVCEDCESVLDSLAENEPLICRKCLKRRSERKEIITEIVETEEKYSRDLQIILEEFYQPMLVAGLLTPEQLSAIFLNVEELLENSQALAERLRDAVEIAADQGDEDLLTVNIGKLFLEAAPMLHSFESYCVRQGAASLLLASLEKDKELLRIFLRVSQMENTLLRRMNLNSFLMVPVQRVTKYPLLLARLYKVTPVHHETREQLKEAQNKIELHLSHMNSETKDVPSKLWRRISSNSGRRSSTEMDLVNIKLRKIAVDVLEWNHEEAKFALEGRLLFTQPTDNNWRKGRTIKLAPINALLVTNGKSPSRSERSEENGLVFSRHSGVREAALLLVRDKNGRYSLLRDPLYLDRCVIAADPAWQSYFEVQELMGKDTFIFKAEDDEMTRTWYRQLQYHAQGLGTWRKRRNALANIMINGMGLRT